jgi:DNA repair exonuclease SbcCD ATPase subunit
VEDSTIIQRIELIDFENHEHTVIEDLSNTFNLICGESNSGKTSIVRALKLVAFNEFDPRSVRTGAKNCIVSVTTESGTVKVTRGKDNIWDVSPVGQPPLKPFSNIGTRILPEVEQILGFRLVQLGDNAIKANIMDQLEAHFMMAELEGKKATGSVRAQVIDEISGLAGIETLVKKVSTENVRKMKSIKKQEQQAEEIRDKLHDKDKLEQEQKTLEEANTSIEFAEEKTAKAKRQAECLAASEETRQSIKEAEIKLKALIDPTEAEKCLKTADSAIKQEARAWELAQNGDETTAAIGKAKAQLAELPQTKRTEACANNVGESIVKLQAAKVLYGEVVEVSTQVMSAEECLGDLPNEKSAAKWLKQAQRSCEQLGVAEKVQFEASFTSDNITETERKLEEAQNQLDSRMHELRQLLDEITICPINLQPINEECLTKAKEMIG